MDIILLGLVIGMADALLAVGLVLIYKANRVINLAHGEIGAFAVAMMISLVSVAHLNYWLALLCSLAATAVLAALVERMILRRLFRSPRLILMLATIGVAQIVIVARLVLPKPKTFDGKSILIGGGLQFPVPFHIQPVHIGRAVLGSAHFIALVGGPLVALAVFAFLRWSSYGVALRAAADNSQRARLLGIPVRRVSTLAWVIAGVLSGIASILLAPVIGFSAGEAVGMGGLLRGLAAAMVARMENVGVAFGVGLMIGVADQVVFYFTARPGLTDLILFGVVLVTLLMRRRISERAGSTDESSWEASEPVRPLPLEIAQHVKWKAVAAGGSVLMFGVVAAVPWLFDASVTFLIATIFLVAAVAVSMTVLTGWAGQMSLGHWAIAGVGGVFGSKLVAQMHLPFVLAFFVATIVGGCVAVAIGLPALRLEGSALAVVTLGFAVVSSSWLFLQPWFQGGGVLTAPGYVSGRWYYGIAIGFLALTVAITRAIQRSRIGRGIIAVRDNPAQAASFGVSVVRMKLVAFAISGVIAAAAGFLWAAGVEHADSNVFQPVRSLSIIAAVVIGGMGSIAGAILGAFYLLAIPYFLGGISPYIGLLSTGLGLLILLLFLPGGLVRGLFGARDLLARAITGIDPHPLVVPASGLSAGALEAPAPAEVAS